MDAEHDCFLGGELVEDPNEIIQANYCRDAAWHKGRPVSDVIREAIAALVEQRRGDERSGRLLEDNLARHRQALGLLRDDPP